MISAAHDANLATGLRGSGRKYCELAAAAWRAIATKLPAAQVIVREFASIGQVVPPSSYRDRLLIRVYGQYRATRQVTAVFHLTVEHGLCT